MSYRVEFGPLMVVGAARYFRPIEAVTNVVDVPDPPRRMTPRRWALVVTVVVVIVTGLLVTQRVVAGRVIESCAGVGLADTPSAPNPRDALDDYLSQVETRERRAADRSAWQLADRSPLARPGDVTFVRSSDDGGGVGFASLDVGQLPNGTWVVDGGC